MSTQQPEPFRIYLAEPEAFWGWLLVDGKDIKAWGWIPLTNPSAWRENCVHADPKVFVEVQKQYSAAERLRNIK